MPCNQSVSYGDTLSPFDGRTAVKELLPLKLVYLVFRGLGGPKLDRQPTPLLASIFLRLSLGLPNHNPLHIFPSVSVSVRIRARMFPSVPVSVGTRFRLYPFRRYPFSSVPVSDGTRFLRCPFSSVPVSVDNRFLRCPFPSVPVSVGTRFRRHPFPSVPVSFGTRFRRYPFPLICGVRRWR